MNWRQPIVRKNLADSSSEDSHFGRADITFCPLASQ
jgi:hypothetical protein